MKRLTGGPFGSILRVREVDSRGKPGSMSLEEVVELIFLFTVQSRWFDSLNMKNELKFRGFIAKFREIATSVKS